MTIFFYVLVFFFGVGLGLFVSGADDKHEECEERFERMRATLRSQIDAREAEIQRLIKGQP
jgi:hypothetical protein